MRWCQGMPLYLIALSMLFPALAPAAQASSRPDLVTSIMADRFQVFPNERLGVQVKVLNIGGASSGKARSNLEVVVVISRDRKVALPMSLTGTIDYREDSVLAGGYHRRLRLSGQRKMWSKRFHVRLPVDLRPGRWWICSAVDPRDLIRESNEKNNVACKELLVESRGRDTDSKRPEREPRAPSRQSDRHKESKQKVIEGLLGRIFRDPRSESNASAPAGEGKKRREKGRFGNRPPSASACRGKRPLPDLEATAVKTPTRLVRGAKTRVNLMVRNKGRGRAPGYSDGPCGYQVHIVLAPRNGVELPRDGRYAAGTQVLHRIRPTASIPAGKRMQIPPHQKKFRVAESLSAGSYWLCLVVDPHNGVEELDETNNVRCEYKVEVR